MYLLIFKATIRLVILSFLIKVALSDPRTHPPSFFFLNVMEILVPEVESYLEGFQHEVTYAKSA